MVLWFFVNDKDRVGGYSCILGVVPLQYNSMGWSLLFYYSAPDEMPLQFYGARKDPDLTLKYSGGRG